MGYAGHWRKPTSLYLHIYNIHICVYVCRFMGFPGGVSGKEPTCQSRRRKRGGFDPWVRKIPWRRAWQPTLVYSCLENPMDREAWWAIVQRVAKSWTRLKRLSAHVRAHAHTHTHTHTHTYIYWVNKPLSALMDPTQGLLSGLGNIYAHIIGYWKIRDWIHISLYKYIYMHYFESWPKVHSFSGKLAMLQNLMIFTFVGAGRF